MTLDYIFHPRSIAVVGASEGPFNGVTQVFLDTLIKFKYRGGIYPVNPKFEKVSGLKCHPSVRDIPDVVDHVISIVPASATPKLLDDCIAKGVKTIHLYTSGFAETDEEERGTLQQALVDTARRGGVRIIGPNCMGLYVPSEGITYSPAFPRESGKVSFISQSGSYSLIVVRGAGARGVRFNKVISYGNAGDIDECELIEYLADDAETEVVAAYIEGTNDGRRLHRVLSRAAVKKPVIVIKRGDTEAGSRGASSHTGALAGNDKVWDALLRQTGVIRVEDAEEMIDMLATFSFFPLPGGRRVAVMGNGGGPSVRAADDAERGGLILPEAPASLRQELKKYSPVAGSMLRNPFDIGGYHFDWAPVIDTIAGWDQTDMIIWQIAPDIEPFDKDLFFQFCIDQRAKWLKDFEAVDKPVAVSVHASESDVAYEIVKITRRQCVELGMAFYPSVYRAARAIDRYIAYYEWL
ncbi:MAG: CoA-binding protein, partial [Chloroflexota bacterium]|nr:CoA-binding protein [Chloroflexota bacterium]